MSEQSVGKLILCATPIGNLEDITLRVIRALKEADLIAAEDTRNSRKLLNHLDIHVPMTSYHEHNKIAKAKSLVERMLAGETIALITDAGTPGISDPGEELVKAAYEAGVPVTSLPGAAACITALTLSGLPTRRFVFEAFLPQEKKDRQEILDSLREETRTIVLYEAPHRLKKTLAELKEALGGSRKISLCRELTKVHEEVRRLTLDEALSHYEANEPRGEYVLVLEGKDPEEIRAGQQARWEALSLEEHMEHYLSAGHDRKEAMKLVAKDRGVAKSEIYKALIRE